MSSPEDKKLKELLANKNDQHQDDFEKEALEGFAMLRNEQESLDLKAKLDERMRKEILSKQKTRPPFYWIAAAAMLIIMGLSVWFILSDSSEVTSHKDLAITQPKETTDAATNTEKSFEAKAAELKPLVNTNEGVSAPPSKNINQFKSEPPMAAGESAGKSQPMTMELESKATASSGHLNVTDTEADLAMEKSSADVVLAAKNEPEADDQSAPDRKEDMEISSDKNLTSKAKKENIRKEKSKSYSDQQPVLAASTKPARVEMDANACGYRGGNTALYNDLEVKLKAIELNKSFEAILSIDQTKKVVEVKFLKTNDLTADELEKIGIVLKMLDKFKPEGKEGLPSCFFNLSYQPSGH